MDPYRQAADASRPGRPPPPAASGRVDAVWAPREAQAAPPFPWPAPDREPRPLTSPATPHHRHPRVPEQRSPADPSVDPPTVPTLVASGRAPAPPPPEVRAAFWLWLTAAALGVAGAAVTLVDTRALVDREMIRAGDDPLTARLLEAILTRTVVVVVVVGLVSALLHVSFAVLMRRGHGWARTVLAVLGTAAIVSAIRQTATAATMQARVDVGDTTDALSLVLLGVQALLLLAAVVLFFRPRANHHYRTQSVRREVSRARRAMTR